MSDYISFVCRLGMHSSCAAPDTCVCNCHYPVSSAISLIKPLPSIDDAEMAIPILEKRKIKYDKEVFTKI